MGQPSAQFLSRKGTVQTTDATPIAVQAIAIDAGDVVSVIAHVRARDAVTGESNTYHIEASFENTAAAASEIGANTNISTKEEEVAWAVSMDALGATWRLLITGDATNAVDWSFETFERSLLSP